jgi:hypothetical protein
VLAYRTALELDIAQATTRTKSAAPAAQRWCSLVTPVLKAACTDQAFHGASDCLQVFGGHGYIREWGIEQIVRDSRVAMIYEGTNEIQAIDLLVRKVLPDGGAALAALLLDLRHDLDAAVPEHAEVLRRLAELRYATTQLAQAAQADAQLPYWIAGDYLRAVALALLAWAATRIDAAAPRAAQPARWQRATQALRRWVMPEFSLRLGLIKDSADKAAMLAGQTAPAAPAATPANA